MSRLAPLRGSGFFANLGVCLVVNIGLAIYVVAHRIDLAWWYWVPIVWGLVLMLWGAWLYWASRQGILDDDSRFDAATMVRHSPW
jgi:hypothetical protein